MVEAVTGQPLQYLLHLEAAAGDGSAIGAARSPPLHRVRTVGRAHFMH